MTTQVRLIAEATSIASIVVLVGLAAGCAAYDLGREVIASGTRLIGVTRMPITPMPRMVTVDRLPVDPFPTWQAKS